MRGFPPKRILITAGPTREMLDPVRFLSNLSTGKMGYTLAQMAQRRKWKVTLISGPTALRPPQKVKFIPVTSAKEMKLACEKYFPRHDVLVMTAAVCDFTAGRPRRQKIHRQSTKRLRLKQTEDIVAGLARRKGHRLVVGFCLETEDWIRRAFLKLKRKRLDGMVANPYHVRHNPFGDRKITVAFMDPGGRTTFLRNQSKAGVARRLLDWLEDSEKFISERTKK